MKKLFNISACLLFALAVSAQETYENANIATGDLNGTARYVGMGGAMDALGADISTISSNPAGIGLFRHTTANISFGGVMQHGGSKFANGDKTNASFDQAGFVYSRRAGRNSFLNLAFNYHKSRNFNYILSASDALNGASQNKLSYIKGDNGLFDLKKNSNGEWVGNSNAFNQLDYLYYNTVLNEEDPTTGDQTFLYSNATGYMFNRASSGYIGEYDFNISGNINDRVYLGLTFGIHDVHYKGYSEYTETLSGGIGDVSVADERRISGTGFDIKAGVIWRPVEESPFRVGFSVSTPVFYDLTTENYTSIANNSSAGLNESGWVADSYDFKLYTPWKFGLSLGHTIGNNLALGFGYEYADYSSMDTRVNDGGYYDYYYDYYYDSSSSDRVMNDHTSATLKGVSTIKLGAEYKPMSNLALRIGYNYISPMYSKDGFKDGSLDSNGSYYGSSTDYTNWNKTNRFTLGIGYAGKKFSADLAYQYSVTSGEFSPFMNYFDNTDHDYDNICNSVNVSNKRSQLLLTLGYHF